MIQHNASKGISRIVVKECCKKTLCRSLSKSLLAGGALQKQMQRKSLAYGIFIRNQYSRSRRKDEGRDKTEQMKLNYGADAIMPQPTIQGTLEHCSPFELSHSELK